MKSPTLILLAGLLLAASPAAHAGFFSKKPAGKPASASALELKGEIDGENVIFTLSFQLEATSGEVKIPLVTGDVAYIDEKIPARFKVQREGKCYYLKGKGSSKSQIEFRFASLPVKQGVWRHTCFSIPDANIRKLSMLTDRTDLEVVFPGALSVDRKQVLGGKGEVTAFLGVSDQFEVRWKPEVKQLDAELVVAADANTIATASVGALRMDTIFNYRVVQGSLNKLAIELPKDSNVTRVEGEDIREWTIAQDLDGTRKLLVDLNRPREDRYLLQVESELVLPPFPNTFSLPVLRPLEVIRTSGFLLIGTDSAIKLQVSRASGLTQIDHAAFPALACPDGRARPRPNRSTFAYQYANMPYVLELSADDIVTAFNAEERMVLSLTDRDLVFNADVELDVRDAPAQEVVVEVDPAWIVVNVEGKNVSDYDVREEAGGRLLKLYFREGVLGHTLFSVRLEKSLEENDSGFALPLFSVRGAKTERGHLVLSAEKGVRLVPKTVLGLREVHTGSVPVRVVNAQSAYRFKARAWKLELDIEATQPAIYAEIFHLVSLGDGVLYGSSTITCHMTGAPVRSFKLSIPEDYRNVEFVGRDLRGWVQDEQDGTVYTVSLQEKVIGDYTLLVTYDQPFDYEGGQITVGGLSVAGAENEFGYIALAGEASIAIEQELSLDPTLIAIDRLEIPNEYAQLINDPVIKGYKYVNAPHAAVLSLKRSPTQPLLNQVNDHTTLITRFSEEGESVTRVLYFVKNTSQQYLGISLPPGARLWSSKVDGRNVQALDTQEQVGNILIPLERHRDPNRPSWCEIVYAQSHEKFGLKTNVRLHAPVCAAQSVFAKWTVDLPEDFTVASEGGNMMGGGAVAMAGLRGVGGSLAHIGETVSSRGGGWIALYVVALLSACLIAFNACRRRGLLWSIPLALVLVAAAFVTVGNNSPRFETLVHHATPPMPADVTERSFSKVVSLADSSLHLDLGVAPAWIGAGGSLFGLVAGLALGLVVALVGWRRKSPTLAAGGLTGMVWGLSLCAGSARALPAVLSIALPLLIAFFFIRFAMRFGRKHLAAHPLPEVAEEPEAPPPSLSDAAPSGQGGHASIGFLLLLFIAAMMATPLLAGKPAPAPAPPPPDTPAPMPEAPAPAYLPVMDAVEISVTGPGTSKKDEKVARFTAQYRFDAEQPCKILVLHADAVLTDYQLGSRNLSMRSDHRGYFLDVSAKGSYAITLEYLSLVQEADGKWSMGVYLPANLKNKVTLTLPETGLDVQSSEAVLLKTDVMGLELSTTAVFGPQEKVSLSWQPQVRQTELEDAVFFVEMNSVVTCEAGVINLSHLARFQIAQGQLQSLNLDIPAGMSVTAVKAAGLSTWRFDSNTRRLEALLDKPASGTLEVLVITQVPQEGLPYAAEFSVPVVQDAARQRGALAVAAPPTVDVVVDAPEGLNMMNVGDFPYAAIRKLHPGTRAEQEASVKRALRYHQLPVSAKVAAEQVLPELRLYEQAQLDISDERIFLTSKLQVGVSKAGIFQLRLDIPADYEVESLTGQDISHWDEVKEDDRGVLVHFTKQITGQRELNIVLARTEKGIEAIIPVPRVRCLSALKHTGTLAVSGEHGIRFMTANREGVSEINPREIGINLPGYLAFKLLRPNWAVDLKTEVSEAVVKAEVLQRTDLSEGLIQGTCLINYTIDGAGIKQLLLQSPQPGIILSVTGRDIAHVQEIDKAQGIWQVSLHNKVGQKYRLEVSYQIPHNANTEQMDIAPLKALDVQSQKGYLAVMAGGRIQIEESAVSQGLTPENARNIPGLLGGGDLSDAILCYRATRGDYGLSVAVHRHRSASVLPATVRQVRLGSVISDDEQLVTRVNMLLRVGDLRFLTTQLPQGSQIWSVFVEGRAAVPLVDGAKLMIPLDAAAQGKDTHVEFIYGGQSPVRGARHRYTGPQFDLPLNDIEWVLFTPTGKRYIGFEGMQHRDEESPEVYTFNAERYIEDAESVLAANMRRAEEVLDLGNKYAREGDTRAAKRAFAAAMQYSVGQDDFNEDARVQYMNAAKEEAKEGLFSRRGNLKRRANIQDPSQAGRPGGGQYADFLDNKERQALDKVAEKLLAQQTAAAGDPSTIHVTMPIQGQRMSFYRALQTQPFSEMFIAFRSVGGRGFDGAWTAGLLVLFFAGFRLLLHPRKA